MHVLLIDKFFLYRSFIFVIYLPVLFKTFKYPIYINIQACTLHRFCNACRHKFQSGEEINKGKGYFKCQSCNTTVIHNLSI